MSVVAGSNGRRLQKRQARKDGWTRAKRALYLDTFAATCNTTFSAKKCGMSDHSVRALKKRDPQFAILCEDALQEGYERLEAELVARSLGHQIEDENPTEEDRTPLPDAEFDPQMALKVLQYRAAQEAARTKDRRGRIFVRTTQDETDAALMKKLAAVERRLTKARS